MQLNDRSKNSLKGVNSKLVELVNLVAKNIDTDLPGYTFIVTEGVRTLERQKQMVAEKKSRTMNSKHLTGHAIDILVYKNGKDTWEPKDYKPISVLFKKYAKELNINLTWGGDWGWDSVHFEVS